MSRIGQQPITIPDNVTVDVQPDAIVVSGPKGQLHQARLDGLSYQIKDGVCLVERADDSKLLRSRHGLMRSLVANMVVGVTDGFEKSLEVVGIGYKVRLEQDTLVFNLGFSHEIKYVVDDDIEVKVNGNMIQITGIDKQRVGLVTATIRALKKPEPYKGKGIRERNEVVRRKAGKGAKTA